MKLLITGGAGFMGSAVVRKLAQDPGYRVSVVDCLSYAGDMLRIKECEKLISFHKVDIRDYTALKRVFSLEAPDLVVNFAAHTHVDRSIISSDDFVTTNVFGTHNLLRLSKEFGVGKFIQVSTDEVYGELGKTGSFGVDTPLRPNSPYSASKASADHFVHAFRHTYGLNTVIFRCVNNYGPWQYPEKFIPVIIARALSDMKVPVYAKGENVREWIYVDDYADAIVRLFGDTKHEVYNIGSGYESMNIDIVKKVLRILGKPESLIEFVQDRPGHDFRYSMNSSVFRREFGWSPKVDLDTGLRLTVEWYKANLDWVKGKAEELRGLWGKVYKP